MDNIIPLRGTTPSPIEDEVVEAQSSTPDNAWSAAAISAISDQAVWGCMLYVTPDGDFVRIPIKACHVSLRGLFEVALDDIKLD